MSRRASILSRSCRRGRYRWPHFSSADAITTRPSGAAVPEATPVVRLVGSRALSDPVDAASSRPDNLQAQNIELPGVLETTGQITFDDRRVSTIVSRVQGRIEQTRVSLWDNVRRGEPIIALYSPDFMTAEAEYLQAHDDRELTRRPAVGGVVGFCRRSLSRPPNASSSCSG